MPEIIQFGVPRKKAEATSARKRPGLPKRLSVDARRVRVGDDLPHKKSGVLWTVTAIRDAKVEDLPRWTPKGLVCFYLCFEVEHVETKEKASFVARREEALVVERVCR